MGSATIESLTRQEIGDELLRLEHELTMSVELAEELAAADALNPVLYQRLRRIRDLRWLLDE